MRGIVQRVSQARVVVQGSTIGEISCGLLIYVAVGREDSSKDVAYLVDKVRHVRIFCDEAGRMNRDVVQAGGAVLVVSAFTVHADVRKGRRPSFERAAPREEAVTIYEQFCNQLAASGVQVERGSYGEEMEVHSVNDGPVCILLDSLRSF